jgi:hypothetical protein
VVPAVDRPDNVVISRVDMTICRIRLPSVTNRKLPSEETVNPDGAENNAFDPTPFVLPEVGRPTNDVTSRVERMIWRTRRFELSATQARSPLRERAIPRGMLKRALEPMPSWRFEVTLVKDP